MADDQWYYTQNDQRAGPVQFAALRSMAAAGSLRAEDFVWQSGMTDWVPATSIPGLMPVAAATPMGGGYYGGLGTPVAQGAYAVGQQAPYGHPAQMNYFSPQAPGVVYAGFWLRVVASIVDGIILAIASGIVGFILGLVIGMTMAAGGSSSASIQETAGVVGNLVGIVVNWLYFAFMESSSGQATLGKKAMGIQVVSVHGGRVSFGQATGRYFGKVVSALILGIGFMMAGWTQRKQALHDMMAGCLVIKRPPGT